MLAGWQSQESLAMLPTTGCMKASRPHEPNFPE
jgi:hypothetical protein